jgi:hypothetical protein
MNTGDSDAAFDLGTFPVHLGLGATASILPRIDGTPEWYEQYTHTTASDAIEGRLVSMYTFTESWSSWEVHPNGHELVVCTAGSITLIQEVDGSERRVTLATGQAAINAPGVWHTADVDHPCTALFITAGVGTEHRER